MAISASGDIILDVVRAADPAAVETARARLASLANRASETSFADAANAGAAGTRPAFAAAPDAFAKFEAMVLQTFIQTMLPKDAQSVYGEGMAGEMWQTLLAERLGEAMAARGGVGIADRILRDHYRAGEETFPLQGVSNDPARPERAAQEMLSVAMLQEIQRKTMQDINEDRAAATIVGSR